MLGPYREGLGKPSGNGVVIVARQVEHLDQSPETEASVFILLAPDGLRPGEEVDNLDRANLRDGCLFQPAALLDEPCVLYSIHRSSFSIRCRYLVRAVVVS